MAIFDTMQTVTPDIYTICLGIAASMASFILLGGEPTKRIAFPHARIMLHQPASAYYRARTPEFLLEVEELHKVREMITTVYALRTGKPFWLYPKTWKEMFLCQQTKPKLMDLSIL
jgi:ATP-dependent Clp protease, protease subunit